MCSNIWKHKTRIYRQYLQSFYPYSKSNQNDEANTVSQLVYQPPPAQRFLTGCREAGSLIAMTSSKQPGELPEAVLPLAKQQQIIELAAIATKNHYITALLIQILLGE